MFCERKIGQNVGSSIDPRGITITSFSKGSQTILQKLVRHNKVLKIWYQNY
jgi:hypothetical protein